jgi:hypothetical protein
VPSARADPVVQRERVGEGPAGIVDAADRGRQHAQAQRHRADAHLPAAA